MRYSRTANAITMTTMHFKLGYFERFMSADATVRRRRTALAWVGAFAGALGGAGCGSGDPPGATPHDAVGSGEDAVSPTQDAVTGSEVYCTGSPCRLSWKGVQWNVSSGSHAGGGTAQSIVTSDRNFYVDSATGYLHTRISKNGGAQWNTAEAFATTNTGFGTYQYVVHGRLDDLGDIGIVWSGHLYGPASDVGADGENEIDVEFSFWNNEGDFGPQANNVDVNSWPSTGHATGSPSWQGDYKLAQQGVTDTTVRIVWSSTSIRYYLMNGVVPVTGEPTQLAIPAITYAPTNPTTAIPQSPIPFGFNHWIYNHVPPSTWNTGADQDITITDYVFVPQ